MVEVIVYPVPDLSAGGEKGQVGYSPMQDTTHSQSNNIPSSPTHSSCRPLTSFPAVHLSQYVASWLVGWLLGWLLGWLVAWLVGCLVGCCLLGWLAGCLVG